MRINGIDIRCPRCGSCVLNLYGKHKGEHQNYRCTDCGRQFRVGKNDVIKRKKREVEVVSYYFYGFPVRLIAEIADIDASTVQRIVKRFREKHINVPANKNILKPKKELQKYIKTSLRKLNSKRDKTALENRKAKQLRKAHRNINSNARQGKLLDGCF